MPARDSEKGGQQEKPAADRTGNRKALQTHAAECCLNHTGPTYLYPVLIPVLICLLLIIYEIGEQTVHFI